MGIQYDIEEALSAAVIAMFSDDPDLSAIPYALPNRVLDVTIERKVVVSLLRNNQNNYAWDQGTEYPGILQFMLSDGPNKGTTELTGIADKIVSHFPKGRIIRYGAAVVKIEVEPEILGVVQDGHKAELPVSVRYRCFA